MLKQFSATMEAVLELLDTVSPHVASLDDSSRTGVALPAPPAAGAELIAETFKRFEAEREPPDDGSDNHEEGLPLSNEQASEFAEVLVEAYEDPDAIRAIGEALITVTTRPRREHLLHGALLTMAVSNLETAIAGVGTQHYSLHPDALPAGEKEFSLAELAAFDDLRDARAAAISRRVEDLMRSGFDAWDKWFHQLLGEGFEQLAADRDALHEAIQRRHLVVHNGGRVSRQYKARVPACESAAGEALPIDRDYLEAAIDGITIFGIRLILLAWSRWNSNDTGLGIMATDLVFEQLIHDRLDVARCVAETAGRFVTEDRQRLFLRVNRWQAEKRLFGLEQVRDEVDAWDTSALSDLYSAAKAALLEDYEELFPLLRSLVEHNELGATELRQWPLFKEGRERDEWTEIEALLPAEPQPDETSDPPPSS